tara:strand:+ start:6092 stop:7606 length:1515 start_codon:yes stop_codon:yes gene_type:complete
MSDELAERAKIIADATGRTVADVLEDLGDDGILNDSNKSEKDLITQLKEAAELISTVQQINNEVSENTVLNGGDNKTNVTVETTLEGDIVDRAIASVSRKAENLKKIAIIIIPVFLLITGGSMSNMGMFSTDESSPPDTHEEYNDYGGCLAQDAQNYDPMASWDDGSCQFDNNNNNNCEEHWEWDLYGEIRGDNAIWIDATFKDMNYCYIHIDAEITMTIHLDGEYYDEKVWNNRFDNEWKVGDGWSNLPEGEYNVEIEARSQGSNWHQNVDGLFAIYEESCEPDYSSSDSWATNYDNKSLQVHMKIINHNDCESDVGIMISFYKDNSYQDSYDEVLGKHEILSGETEIVIRHDDWTNLEDANYSFETRFFPEGQGEECCEMTDNVMIYTEPEPPCNGSASFYSATYEWLNETNDTISLKVIWDADWSCDETQDIEIDIYLKDANNSTIYGNMFAYGTQYNDADSKSITITNISKPTNGYRICLAVWINSNGWRMDDEWSEVLQ